ncbi:MAG TPA: membrane protein insertion efficiency factor YidD, partial [Aquella sp.]|nr:membrane protein insertion efficiency factor YidD [Aquella sp.]
MKKVIMILIRLYWLTPKNWRRECIFKISCSEHIYQTAKSKGFKKAILAFRERYKQCRPHYKRIRTEEGLELVILND